MEIMGLQVQYAFPSVCALLAIENIFPTNACFQPAACSDGWSVTFTIPSQQSQLNRPRLHRPQSLQPTASSIDAGRPEGTVQTYDAVQLRKDFQF
jgi:hypothetical protein